MVFREVGMIGHIISHLDGHVGNVGGVSDAVAIKSAHHHIRVAHGLDFLEPVFFTQHIEARKYPVQQTHHLGRSEHFGELGKIHQVHKHHGDIRITIGYQPLAVFQTLRDSTRQHVQQHPLGFFLFFFQQLMLLIELGLDPFHLDHEVAH